MKIKKVCGFIVCISLLSSCSFIIPSSSSEQKDYVKVTFYDGDNTILLEKEIEKGEDITYKGKDPSLEVEEGKEAVFVSWDKPLNDIIEDTSFYPEFTINDKYYTVNYYGDDNTLLDSISVKHNDSFVYDKIPTKESDEYYDYEFRGWYDFYGNAPNNVTKNLHLYADFTKTRHSYDVIFKNENGWTLERQIIKKGEYASYTGEIPTKEPSELGTYSFIGFSPDPETTPITQDTEFVAKFRLDYYTYDVVFKDDDGTILYQDKVSHNSYYGYPLDEPVKESEDPKYFYTFSYWIPQGDYQYSDRVKEDREFVAKYYKHTKSFKVSFKTGLGYTDYLYVDYGEKAYPIGDLESPKDGYTKDFIGWDFDFSTPIYSDTEINAIWTDWYYTKDGLERIQNYDNGEYTYKVKCANETYKTFLITGPNIPIKDGNNYYTSRITGVIEDGCHGNFVVKKVVFDDIPTLVNIGKRAFENCLELETVILNDYITRIEEDAFYACKKLKTVYLPASLEYLGDCSFGFTDVENVFYKGTVEMWEAIEKEGYPRLVPENMYYYSETEPIDTLNKYWRYVDGEMVPW